MFTLLFTELGMSEAVGFCLDAAVVLTALQYLLRGTADSPLRILRRYRNVNLPVAVGVTGLLFLIGTGTLTFASVFLPRLYSVMALFRFEIDAPWELIPLFFGVAALGPFYEELVFRGLALGAYRKARSPLFAVVFTSLLFGLVHGSIVHVLFVFPVGIVLALVMLKTGQLWTSVAAHGLYNFLVTVLAEFNLPKLPSTPSFGILGLVVAATALLVAVRWLGLPEASAKRNERESVWTASLVVAVVFATLSVVATTYEALGPGIKVLP